MTRFVPLLIFVAALAIGTWLLTSSGNEVAVPGETAHEPASQATAATATPDVREDESIPAEAVSTVVGNESPSGADCLDDDAIADRAMAQIHLIGPIGADFDALLAIDEEGLKNLAAQDNSAAMATLGLRNILKAKGQDPGDAATLLNSLNVMAPGSMDNFGVAGSEFEPNQLLDLQEANYWLYQSALRGRVLMLAFYGDVIGKQFGGAVGLGWLTREEYNTMSADSRAYFEPARIYARTALDIAGMTEAVESPVFNDAADQARYDALVERVSSRFLTEVAEFPAAVEVIDQWNGHLNELMEQSCDTDPRE